MDAVPVEVPRIPDRDELLQVFQEHGLDARAHDAEDWLGLEIPCGDGEEDAVCKDVLHQVETLLAETASPLVPVLAEGRVFLRPPGS